MAAVTSDRFRVPLETVTPPAPVGPGDRVAVLSPSMGLPALFPEVHELGLQRMQEELHVVPVEYPTTRKMGASAAERVVDLHAAFADPTIAAIMTTIGGEDQITLLRHLDRDLLAANPKRFFGYSDNTNLLNYLVGLGMTAYHGGSTMVQLGRGGGVHPHTLASLRRALTGGRHELRPAVRYADHPADWSVAENRHRESWSRPAIPWAWPDMTRVVEGRVWGGCLEILDWTFQVGRHAPDAEDLRGAILFLETSDEVPPAVYVRRTLRNLGERGILDVVDGLVMARPAAQQLGSPVSDEEVTAYVQDQREAVATVVDAYRPDLLVVHGVDAGHTDPQQIVPIGGVMSIDAGQQRLWVDY